MKASFALFALTILFTPCVFAMDLAVTPIPERVALAEAIVVGHVMEVEAEPITVETARNGSVKVAVAKVRVKENLQGAEELKDIRVAFTSKEDQPNDGYRIPTPVLEKGNDVLLFLIRRKNQDCYFLRGHFSAIGKERTFLYQTEDITTITEETK